MKVPFTPLQGSDYKVETPVYQGPLDLLLQLIERAELDITSLALALVTDQYLTHIKSLEAQDAEDVSAFLVIAAKLLQIKSEALLPRPPVREVGEEDIGEALARQLLAYRRYKEISVILKTREALGLKTYLRLAPPPKVETQVDLSEYTIQDILEAARAAFIEADNRQELGTVVAVPRVTIRDKIGIIVKALRIREDGFIPEPFRRTPQPLGRGSDLPGNAGTGQTSFCQRQTGVFVWGHHPGNIQRMG